MVANEITTSFDAAPEGCTREAYYAGWLHCWGLLMELNKPRPAVDSLVPAMRQCGFAPEVIDAFVTELESPY